MDDINSRSLLADPETRRALQLDTLSAILPVERRDRLAELLTDDDVETLKHLAREGIGENSLRALLTTFGTRPGARPIPSTECRPTSRLRCAKVSCCAAWARMRLRR